MSAEEAVCVNALYKRYKKVEALKGVTFRVNTGEIYGIIGPDGAGKSTLLKVVAGVLSFDKGEVRVLNHTYPREVEDAKRLISFMPQGLGQNLYMDLTVDENIDFFARLKGKSLKEVSELKERLLEITGLKPFRNRYARHLSGGMQQKLGVCCSLISKPRLLILDEPTTGVDPISRRELWELLYQFLDEGITIVYSTSYMDEAERAHRFSLMHEGRILGEFGAEELRGKGAGELFTELVPFERAEISIPFGSVGASGGVEVRDLTKRFGSFTAVDGVSFEVAPGEIFGLLGPNGAGKTTTIKMMVGLLKPTSGVIKVPPKDQIGYMSQRFSLYRDLTVEENIDYYAALYGISGGELARRKEWILAISNLVEERNRLVWELPLGFRQRLALGCSFIHLPRLLFLDEPTSGVDPATRELFWDIIRKLAQELGVSIVITTHHLLEAHYCHRLALMNAGRIVAMGTPRELVEQAEKIKGPMFEVEGEGIREVKALLEGMGVTCYYFGRRLRVWGRVELDRLQELVSSCNCRVYPASINMEDVFILFSGEGVEASLGCGGKGV